MARSGFRKLVDIWGSEQATAQVHDALKAFLLAHGINFERHHGTDAYHRDYYRYLVQSKDLCCAQAVLPALREIQEGAVRGAGA
jgi:hypothetical protein